MALSGSGVRLALVAAAAAALIAAITLFGHGVFLRSDGERAVRTSLEVADALSADTAGFERAVVARTPRFPEDHGAHPEYRTEWWYYTGNLESADGHRFGFQFTIFRTALSPDTTTVAAAPQPRSAADSLWSTSQLFMAHFAMSDVTNRRFFSSERFSRGAAGLAGAKSAPYHVWLEDWSISGAGADSVRLVAATDAVALDLTLSREKPIVLHGDRGLDSKGPEPGNASYYYSMTRMSTTGAVSIGQRTVPVEGHSWMDHEWSTSALGDDQIGWDWFALQLESGRDVMYYRLRERDGGSSAFSSGTLVGADGTAVRLGPGDVRLEPVAHWQSPVTDAQYPIAWDFSIPQHGLELRIRSLLPDQELRHSVVYWEGAVRITGSESGYGFVELTGYSESDGRLTGRSDGATTGK